MSFPSPNPKLLSDKWQGSWRGRGWACRQAETQALCPGHPGDVVLSWSMAWFSEKRSSQGLLKRLGEDRELERRGNLNYQSWAIRSIGLCSGWEVWKNMPPCPFPSPSPLSLPSHQRGVKITALQFILWFCCSQWLEMPVSGMTYVMWWEESTKIFTNSYEMQLLPQQNQAAHEWNTATPPQRLKTNSALKQFCEPNTGD